MYTKNAIAQKTVYILKIRKIRGIELNGITSVFQTEDWEFDSPIRSEARDEQANCTTRVLSNF